MKPSPTSVAAAPSHRCAPRSTPQPPREREEIMNYVPKIDRRSFVIGSAAAGAGLTLGMSLPFGAAQAQVQAGAEASPELNAWVVVRPDDTVVIRFARSEMGQGALTGL